METTLTDEQRLLRETVTDLANDLRATPEALGSQRDRASSWQTIAELGLLTMRWPEAAGGVGATATDLALVAEALGRAPAVVPFAGPVIAAELLSASGLAAADLARTWEAGAATIALDPGTLEVAGVSGVAALAWDAAGAERAIALDRDGTVRPLAVARAPLPSADLTRVIRSTGAAGDPLGTALDAEARARLEALALTVLSADLVGVMSGALQLAVVYARDRHQFGKPIGAFQALAHMLAEAHVALEAARSATTHAAWAVDRLSPADALLAARVAKAYAARVALGVTEVTVQVHGGIGTTWESACHLFVRRALTGAAVLGDEPRLLDQIADTRLRGG